MMQILVLLVICIFHILPFSSPAKAKECIGDCISVQECPALNSVLEKYKKGKADINILRNAVCENNVKTGQLNVCCHKLPSICGLNDSGDKIVNGENAELGQWPWMVIFRGGECRNCDGTCDSCPSGLGESNWKCGGILITAQHVLSAAHCFQNTQIEYARIGEFDLSNNTPDKGRGLIAPLPQDIKVERVTKHPKYGEPFKNSRCSRCNDIAIVKLAAPAQMHDRFVSPICVPLDPLGDMEFEDSSFQGKVAKATGWGVTDAGDIWSTRGSNILQQVNLTIQDSSSFCREQKSQFPEGSIMCVGQGDGKGTCRADSGGPLMLADRKGRKWYVVGITSFGPTACGAKGLQDIFTSVYYYKDWIKQNLF